MSYGGGAYNNGVNNSNANNYGHHENDWDYRDQAESLGNAARASQDAYGNNHTDPFGANDDFNDGYENFTPSQDRAYARFGRPSAGGDLESEHASNHGGFSRTRQNLHGSQYASAGAAGPSSYQVPPAASLEPPQAGRATSAVHVRSGHKEEFMSGDDAVVVRAKSNQIQQYGDGVMSELFDEYTGGDYGDGDISNTGVSVGIGVASLQDPYPSLRTTGAILSHQESELGSATLAAIRRSPNAHLPSKKEATPMMPPTLAVEPAMPRPRVSRRFLSYTRLERQPDMAVAQKVKNARYKQGDDDKHVLKCPNCKSFLKIPKMAVLMQCPTCSTVSPATSSTSSAS